MGKVSLFQASVGGASARAPASALSLSRLFFVFRSPLFSLPPIDSLEQTREKLTKFS